MRTLIALSGMLFLGLVFTVGSPATIAQSPASPGFTRKHIYDEKIDPRVQVAEALQQAKREHKRVLLTFGGDWCGDCQVLDLYLHQPANAELLEKNFVIAHIFIGQMDKNLDLALKYGVPIENGVPALSVVSPDGKVIYAQKTGGFSDMRHMDTSAVHDFLLKWKA